MFRNVTKNLLNLTCSAGPFVASKCSQQDKNGLSMSGNIRLKSNEFVGFEQRPLDLHPCRLCCGCPLVAEEMLCSTVKGGLFQSIWPTRTKEFNIACKSCFNTLCSPTSEYTMTRPLKQNLPNRFEFI